MTNVAPGESNEFDQGVWDDEVGEEGELDLTWEVDNHEYETASIESSSTLSSKSSTKRSLTEAELEDYQDEEFPPSTSPGLFFCVDHI